jgi:hypothetical protein
MSTTQSPENYHRYGPPSRTVQIEATDENPLYWMTPAQDSGATQLYSIREGTTGKERILACDCYEEDAVLIIDALRFHANAKRTLL